MMMEFGYLLNHCGTALLIYKISKQKSVYGICIDTQICYLLALVARCVWIFDTQLATMNLTYVEVWIGLTTQVWLLWQCHSFKDILYHDKKSIVFKWFSVVGLCTVLSIILHPGKKGDFFFTL